MRNLVVFFLFIFSSYSLVSQNISINAVGNPPDASAILDVQSSDKGILIPRMSSAHREAINSPANGLLVFDEGTQSFWFYDQDGNAAWVELLANSTRLLDEDNDTEINVETNPDEDIIRMRIEGEEVLTILENDNNAHRFQTSEQSQNLFFGHNAGLNSSPGFNTFLGYEAGLENFAGDQNLFIGHQAGMDNTDGDGNVFLGYRAGYINDGSFNVFVGRHAGYDNIGGDGNVFMGYGSGSNNLNGRNNVFLGYNTGQANHNGIENTFVGQGSGYYNTTGDFNTFIGVASGRRNRTGNRNVALGNNAMGPNLSSGDHGDGNVAIGFNAGFSMTNSSYNTYLGEDAGYFNDTGDGNTMIGNESGLLMRDGRHNTALGYRAYRHNNGGNNNIAIGDSSMLVSLGSYNIAIGDKAGEEAEGSSNIFIGNRAGAENDGASQNIFIGSQSGFRNSSGNLNTFIGWQTGLFNTSGAGNTLLGHSTGDRNSTGAQNTYVGTLAGHGNTTGNSNVSLGFNSLYGNSDGSGNVGIGHHALANIVEVNNDIERVENTAVGFEAGDNDLGNFNITIGSKSEAGENNYNIALGHEASTVGITTDGTYGIAIGYQAIAGGLESIALGKNANSTNRNIIIGNDGVAGVLTQNAVGIGNDVLVTQSNTIILGDDNDPQLLIGIGRNNPTAKVDIDNNTQWSDALNVRQEGLSALQVRHNRGVSIGGSGTPSQSGLEVQGGVDLNSFLNVTEGTDLNGSLDVIGEASFENLVFVNTSVMPAGYHVAIDGKVACTELRVEAVEDWPDYVFEEDYPLMKISEFRKYIEENNHLPGVPSASEVHENGFEIGKTQEILLEKIEELSLYILQLEERLSKVENVKK